MADGSSGVMGQGAGTLSKAAGMINSAKAELDKISDTAHQDVTGMSAQWQGQGGSAFQTMFARWHEKETQIVKILNDFEQSLGITEKKNMSTDEDQSQRMAKNHARLD